MLTTLSDRSSLASPLLIVLLTAWPTHVASAQQPGSVSAREAPPSHASHPGPTSSDTLAAWVEMLEGGSKFVANQPAPVPVMFGAKPPLLGSIASVELQAASYQFAIILEASDVLQQGLYLDDNLWQTPVHVLPTRIVNTFAIAIHTDGTASFSFRVPADRALVGLDTAWQALTFKLAGPPITGTNLVLANFGTRLSGGSAAFSFQFDAVIPFGYWRDSHRVLKPIYVNRGPAHYITIEGRYAATGMGPIEIQTSAPGHLLATLPKGKLEFMTRVFVPPGLPNSPVPLVLLNQSTTPQSLTWRIRVDR